MKAACSNCSSVLSLEEEKIPVGRSYVVCPKCETRINIFKGFKPGSVIKNLVGLRCLAGKGELEDRFCEPGELWQLIEVIQPCPEKGKGRRCEKDNLGRCPNQRMLVRLCRDDRLFKTCLYKNGRRIFDRCGSMLVGRNDLELETENDDS